MENEIIVKIKLNINNELNNNLYMDIINGLNDRYIPCDEIIVNGNSVFTSTDGFKNKNGGGNIC